jgi:hypothetical protein
VHYRGAVSSLPSRLASAGILVGEVDYVRFPNASAVVFARLHAAEVCLLLFLMPLMMVVVVVVVVAVDDGDDSGGQFGCRWSYIQVECVIVIMDSILLWRWWFQAASRCG